MDPPFIPNLEEYNFDLEEIKVDLKEIMRKVEEDRKMKKFETSFCDEFYYENAKFR